MAGNSYFMGKNEYQKKCNQIVIKKRAKIAFSNQISIEG